SSGGCFQRRIEKGDRAASVGNGPQAEQACESRAFARRRGRTGRNREPGVSTSARPGRSRKTAPLCSVIIPTYNRAEWLPDCVASARASGVPSLEIVVADDGSTDHTREIVSGLGPDVRYVWQSHAGPSAARN